MRRSLVIVALVAAIGIAALVDTLRGGGSPAQTQPAGAKPAANTVAGETLQGPDVPAPKALPGALVFAAPEAGTCRLREIDLRTVMLGDPGSASGCTVWASPAGGEAVVESGAGAAPGARAITLVRLENPPATERRLGEARGDVVWSADGALLAWCRPDGESTVVGVGGDNERTVTGCDPHFAPGGAVLTLPNAPLAGQLLREGEVVLDSTQIARGFAVGTTGPIEVLEFDVAPDGLIALSATRQTAQGKRVVLELWRGDRLQASTDLPSQTGPGLATLGQRLEFSPNGRELAIGTTSGEGEIAVADIDLARVLLRAYVRSFAWSPDGAWLAVAAGGEIRIYGQLRDSPIYTLPVSAVSLGWTAHRSRVTSLP